MHQHPRPPPVSASPALSTKTNPMRSNNQRETSIGSSAAPAQNMYSSNENEEDSEDSGVLGTAAPSESTVGKLDSMLQVRF